MLRKIEKTKKTKTKNNFQKRGSAFDIVKSSKVIPRKSKRNLEQHLRETKIRKMDLGVAYLLAEIFFKIKKCLVKLCRFFKRTSYRLAICSIVIVLAYCLSPGALSAPKSTTVTLKTQWETGTRENIETENASDAIQIKADGTWTARVWAPPPDTISYGHSSVIVGNYIYVFRGYSDNVFWRYDTINNEWAILDDLPAPTYYGADMAYDGAGNIYAIFGGFSKKFYKYNIEDEEWTELPELLDTPWVGAGLEMDGGDVFVTRGGGTSDFWKYDVSEGAWFNLAPPSCSISTGGSLVNGQDGYMYLVCGGATLNFYRYLIEDNIWSDVANLPTGYNMNGEQKGTYYNEHLYFMRYYTSGGIYYYSFLRYNLDGGTWTVLDNPPQSENYTSLNYNENDGLIYAFRGNGTFDLWKFDPDAGTTGHWVGPQQVLDGTGTVGTGGDLIWNGVTGAGGYLYAVRGYNSNSFYRFDIANNTWTSLENVPSNMNTDTKGTYYNGFVYLLSAASNSLFYRFNVGTGHWETLTEDPFPVAINHGSGLAYNSNDGKIYALQGTGTSGFYRYTIGGDWESLSSMATGGVTYAAYVGARIISDGEDLYVILGDGETAFLKYDRSATSWSRLGDTPFNQYYGDDLTYYNGKIYALAGDYKDDTWEYDISDDSWRKLPNNQKYAYSNGPYNGASLEYAGGNSFYATAGQQLADIWSYTLGTHNYLSSAIYVSEPLDLGYVSSWISFVTHENTPNNTSLKYETRTSNDSEDWSNWEEIGGTEIQSPERKYIQVRITLETSDGVNTPTVSDYTISYNSEETLPSNPTAIVASSSQIGGEELISGETYAYAHPYFSWSGASDAESGVEGYYVYFGANASADPEHDGSYQTATTYLATEPMDAGNYYLLIKTKDNDGNVSEDALSAFAYVYDGVSPHLSWEITDADDFSAGTLENVNSTGVADSLRLDSVDGFWNENRLSIAPGTIYLGGESAHASCNGGHDCLFTFRGYNTNEFYQYDIDTDTWSSKANALSAVYWGGTLVEGPDGYLYGAPGLNTSTFWRYDIEQNQWEAMANVPKNLYYGSAMSYDGARYIYALPGNDDAFYRYDTQNNQWTSRTNTNFGNPNTADGQKTYIGTDSVYDGRNNIYVSQGSLYPYFAKYSIANDAEHGEVANTWTPLASAPGGFYEGGSLAYDSENDFVYGLRGNGRQNFFKYDPASNTWSDMPDAPASMSYGASMSVVGGNIYVQRGSATTGFYRFNIEENSWEVPQRAFFGPSTTGGTNYFTYYYGTFMTSDNNTNLYIIRGYYDNAFGKYNTDTGAFTELAKLPVGAYNGANLVYDTNKDVIYFAAVGLRSVRSGANNYFFKYDVATNVWTEITLDRPKAHLYYGSTMTYDGSRYIYLTRGANTTTWWRYDTNPGTADGSRWSNALTAGSGWAQGYGSQIVYKNGLIYSAVGNNTNAFFSYNTGTGEWIQLDDVPAGSANVYIGGNLVDGNDGYLYLAKGYNTDNFFRYKISSGDWEEMPAVPAQVYPGGTAAYDSGRIWMIAGNATSTYNDGLYSYVVGSETNGTGFEKTGTYTSEAIDLTSVYRWGNLSVTYSEPENTSITVYTRTSSDGEDWSSWDQASNEKYFGNNHYAYAIVSAPDVYLQVKFSFTSSNQVYSPVIEDYTVNYYQDIEAPDNPTSSLAYSDNGMATEITSDTWYSYASPHFVWPVEGEVGGAQDNEGGSGVAGYYVCFGTTENCVDPYVDGEFQEENSFTAPALSSEESGKNLQLLIKTVDNAEMIPAETYSAFTYNYDFTAPTPPSDIVVTPAGYTATDSYEFVWENDALDAHAGIAKFQYRTGGDETDVWTDLNDPEAVSITLPNEDHADGAYKSNENSFYLRVVDNAGNISDSISQSYYFSGDAPSPPQNLYVDPEEDDENYFTFTWQRPASFAGDPTKLKYRYSINTLPGPYNTVETSAVAAGPGPFANQKGTNRFYVVAMDESENIEYDSYAYIDFTANTSAPGVPRTVDGFDTSNRETQEYSVAIKWSQPESYDAGNFAGYAIFRSLDNITFEEIAMTTGLAFVDTELESKPYYYYARSKDKTGNYSIDSSMVTVTPTGRYTTAPTIVREPSLTIQAYAASVSWTTNRVASSFIEFGTSMSLGETNGQIDSVTDHTVSVTGLSAGTKYYYRAKFIDVDGNIGTSEISTFETLPPPTISEVEVSSIGLDSAIVSWETNTSATCTLKYGEGSLSSTIEESSGATSHTQKLSNLKSSTIYSLQIDAVDEDLNEFSSDEYNFTTLTQPQVTDLTVDNKENVDLPTIVVNYKTTHATTTLVKFKSKEESSYHNYLTGERKTEHQAEISGLDPALKYEIIATGVDENGIEAISKNMEITTLSDSRPPGITTNRAVGRVVGRGKDAKANLYVKIETDESTRTKVLFGKGTIMDNFEQSSPEDPQNTYHMITIPVDPGQVYSYIIEARDEADNLTKTKPATVVVENSKENATEIVVNTFSSKFGWLSSIMK